MLIRFVVENLYSFQEEVDFNMFPADLEEHTNHVTPGPPQLLRVAALYGGNASGKTNLIKAIAFARSMIVNEAPSLNARDRFLLGNDPTLPSRFEFEVIHGHRYHYGVVFDDTRILEEWLFRVEPEHDQLLYSRTFQPDKTAYTYELGNFEDEDKIWLKNEGRGTSEHVLFLTACNYRTVPFFKEVFQAFEQMICVFPESKPRHLLDLFVDDPKFTEFATALLRLADLGVERLDVEESPVPEKMALQLLEDFDSDRISIGEEEFTFERESKNVISKKLLTYHRGMEGQVPLRLRKNSDGTRRLLQLAPMLYKAFYGKGLCLVDELDRSIHPLLLKRILFELLKLDSSKAGQLIFTTHNLDLLDPELFRADEVWLVDKMRLGNTKIAPLSSFKDLQKDWRSAYMTGMLGGFPIMVPS